MHHQLKSGAAECGAKPRIESGTTTNGSIQDSDPLLSRKQVSERWGCSEETVKRRHRSGQLRGYRIGWNVVRYRLSDVLNYEERCLA